MCILKIVPNGKQKFYSFDMCAVWSVNANSNKIKTQTSPIKENENIRVEEIKIW